VLSDDEAVSLARLGLATEEHYGAPQDTEWAMAGGTTYLVQSRPITTLGPQPEVASGRLLVQGWPPRLGAPRGRYVCSNPLSRESSWWLARSWWLT